MELVGTGLLKGIFKVSGRKITNVNGGCWGRGEWGIVVWVARIGENLLKIQTNNIDRSCQK